MRKHDLKHEKLYTLLYFHKCMGRCEILYTLLYFPQMYGKRSAGMLGEGVQCHLVITKVVGNKWNFFASYSYQQNCEVLMECEEDKETVWYTLINMLIYAQTDGQTKIWYYRQTPYIIKLCRKVRLSASRPSMVSLVPTTMSV